jgi:predicted enzyme related to lactoylglutathione lyase
MVKVRRGTGPGSNQSPGERTHIMSNGPNFIIVHVGDTAKARQFYGETLGYTVEAESPGFVQFNSTNGTTLALSTEQGGDPVELWWFVEDADASHDTMRTNGIEIVSAPRDEPFGRAFAIKDPSGNTLNLLQLPAG